MLGLLSSFHFQGADYRRGYGDGLYPVNANDRNLEDNGYYTSSNKTTRHSR